MSIHSGVAMTIEDRLEELGGISGARIRLEPAQGTASITDLLRVNEAKQGLRFLARMN